MQATSSDVTTALTELNELRQLEGRTQLETLPNVYKNFPAERLNATVREWRSQIKIHKELQKESVEYNNRIILNETEQALYAKNKRNPDSQIQFLKYSQVAVADRELYFPLGENDPAEFAFITNTEATYIQSLTSTQVGDKNICIAKHSIPDCITYVAGTAELTPKVVKKRTGDKPDPKLIIGSRLRSGIQTAPTTPTKTEIPKPVVRRSPPKAWTISSESNEQKQTPLDYLSQESSVSTQSLSDKTFIIPHSEKTQTFGKINSGGIQSFHPPSNASISKNPNPMIRSEDEFDDMDSKEALMKFIDDRVNEHIKKKMEDMAKQGPRQDPDPPNIPRVESNDIDYLKGEIERLRLHQEPKRQFVSTDKDEIMELRKGMADMANYVMKLQEVVDENKLLPEDKRKLLMLTGQSPTSVNPLIYTLNYPDNIISTNIPRAPLNILKAPSVIATIGTFEPDINPKSNFKEIWERIQNYTRNHSLYEHEYVDILMIIMKGSAATALTDMIREYKGKLIKIIEAIQDIYVPHHTIFDDIDELNKFNRPAGENIKTTMRRASLVINKLKNQCTPAAWDERRYHMLLALIKQVIDIQTVRHLHVEELKCAQAGTQLNIPAIISIISMHEQTHDLIPKREMKLHYNINSMQVINHENEKPVKTMTVKENSEKRQTRSSTKELISSQTDKSPNRQRSRETDRTREKRQGSKKEGDRQSYRSRSESSSHQNSQRNNKGDRNYRANSPYPRRDRSQSYDRRDRSSRSQSREKSSYNKSEKRTSDNGNKNNHNSGNGKNDGKQSKYNKTFKHGNNLVTLHFYKCLTCPSMHPTGAGCDKPHEVTSLNM